MDARITGGCSRNGFGRRNTRALALLVAGTSLASSLDCATPELAADGDTETASGSRCAPGSVLDYRHSLCSGQTGLEEAVRMLSFEPALASAGPRQSESTGEMPDPACI